MKRHVYFDPSWNWGTVLLFVGLVFQTGILYSRVLSLEASLKDVRANVQSYVDDNGSEHKQIMHTLVHTSTLIESHLRNGGPVKN